MSSPLLFEMTIPIFRRAVSNLKGVLKLGEKYATENNIPTSEMVNWKLAEDMKPLSFQIQTVSNTVKMTSVRVTGIELPVMDDNETTLEELYARLDKTLEIIDKVEKDHTADFEGKETAEVVMRDMKFTGKNYVQTFALPNFFFHVVTAYDILRNKGVPVGKLDYMGAR
ncbi:hypothetical protein TWF694_006673 [Orbilia ellipsospora]|uniref:DUF1993 domain-containing protein n=1 Tax=Orbilia ellipsospora TaxID=2528407 RepID=A0AAV9XKU1_9PEZI